MNGRFEFQKISEEIKVQPTGDFISLQRNNENKTFQVLQNSSNKILERNGKKFEVVVLYQKDGDAHVWVNGKVLVLKWSAASAPKLADGQGDQLIHSVMPGRVMKIHVQVGDYVELDSPLLILEAMKMENEIKSKTIGKVAQIFVQPGVAVESGARLLQIDPVEDL